MCKRVAQLAASTFELAVGSRNSVRAKQETPLTGSVRPATFEIDQRGLSAILAEHLCLTLASFCYVLCCWYLVARTPAAQFDTAHNWLLWPGFAGTLLIGLVIALCFNVLVLEHPRRPLRFIGQEVFAIVRPYKFTRGIWVLFLSAPIIFYFSQIKSLIPYLNPVDWDRAFSNADQILGLGVYPHTYLSFLISGPIRFQALSFFYEAVWTATCIGTLAYTAFVASPGFRRSRFLLAYFLCWIIIGSVCAILLNSGGPVFFHDYTGSHEYNTLVARLQRFSVGNNTMFNAYALMQQLAGYHGQTNAPPPGMGISAMPSMHVSMAFLTVLYSRRTGAFARMLALLYFIGIYLSSIALGWHYAVDGIVSVALTTAVWILAARLILLQPTRTR